MEHKATPEGSWRVNDIVWRAVWQGYFIGLAFTLAVGVPLLLVLESSWLLGVAGLAGLMLGGFVLGNRVSPPLALVNGALAGILYNLTIALAFFAGWFFQWLPEPLPGLPQGDSTFYFAWPLAQFVVGILGAMLGSRFAVKRVKRGA